MAQQNTKYANPKFDNRIYTLSGLKATAPGTGVSTGDLQRGYMVQDPNYMLGNVQYSLRFLYNPSEVQISHNTSVTSAAALTPQYYRSQFDTAQPDIPLSATVSFNLLFDRTYELWDSATRQHSLYDWDDEPSLSGVKVDIAAAYRVVGILQPKTQTVANPHTSINDPGVSQVIVRNGNPGPMPMTPVQVFFGGPNSLNYRGYVSALSIDVTHWSQLMVPMRCTIGVTLSLLTPKDWVAA